MLTWCLPGCNYLSEVRVFVITHPDRGERIEVFDLIKFTYLKHVKTITDHKFTK